MPAAAAVGIGGIALILVLQRWPPKVPAVLIMVVLAIAATTVFGLAEHGVSLVGVLPKGFPPLTFPPSTWSDLGPLAAGAAGHRPGVVGRHDLDRLLVRRAHRRGRPRQPGDDRDRRGEPRGRPVPGLPGQHQRLAHGGRRAAGRQDPARRRRRRRADHPDDRAAARPVPEPAPAGAGRGGDHRVAVAGRHAGHRAAVAAAQAEFTLSSRRSSAWPCSACCPASAIAVALSILNVFRRAWWPYQTELGRVDGLRRLPRRPLLPGGRAAARAWSSTGSTRRCSSPTPRRSGTRSAGWPGPTRRRTGSWSPPSRSPTWTPPPPTSCSTWTAC